MMNEVNKNLQEVLDKYLRGEVGFETYYPNMNVYSSHLYKKQLDEALELVKAEDQIKLSSFSMYLDTIIINMHTKIKKYKKSIYFDNENVKDIQNQGFTIVFFIDEHKQRYILLGIVKSKIVT